MGVDWGRPGTGGDGGERAGRRVVDVAVGILLRADDREFLLTSRPPGKPYAGYWEFPGGKLEGAETVEQALRRELLEEIGLRIGRAEVWQVSEFDYPHAHVRLHFCRVREWSGEPQPREGQQLAWSSLPVDAFPLLPGALPVLRLLAAQQGYAGEPFRAPPPDAAREVTAQRAVVPGPATSGSAATDTPGEGDVAGLFDAVRWDRDGLVPAIAQEVGSGDILMVAWMNRESLQRTVDEGRAVYWSRSRSRLWRKGEESRHVQDVHELRIDCDGDVLLLRVTQRPAGEPAIACHTGRHACFYRRWDGSTWRVVEPVLKDPAQIYR